MEEASDYKHAFHENRDSLSETKSEKHESGESDSKYAI